jgi:hypothetical protein
MSINHLGVLVATALALSIATDGADDKNACEQAFTDAQRALGP